MKEINDSEFCFTNPMLEELHFTKSETLGDKDYEGRLPILTETKVCIPDCEINSAIVALRVNVGAVDGSTPFFIELVMQSTFTWNDNIPQEDAKKMLKLNAPSLLYGYARQVVAFVTASSRYPIVDLPFANFMDNETSED